MLFVVAFPFSPKVLANETDAIKVTIERLMEGVDQQDGALLSLSLAPNAGIFATSPDGSSIISVSAESFIELHATKKFGGQKRAVEIAYLDITDDLIATAKIVASNSDVHYTYYLGLVKSEGAWKVQTFLQRSRTP